MPRFGNDSDDFACDTFMVLNLGEVFLSRRGHYLEPYTLYRCQDITCTEMAIHLCLICSNLWWFWSLPHSERVRVPSRSALPRCRHLIRRFGCPQAKNGLCARCQHYWTLCNDPTQIADRRAHSACSNKVPRFLQG